MARNVVTLSHLDPDQHHWLKDEARRRSEATGIPVHLYELIGEAIALLQSKSSSVPVGPTPIAAQV